MKLSPGSSIATVQERPTTQICGAKMAEISHIMFVLSRLSSNIPTFETLKP
jgi:hypothetical protein